MSDVLTDAQIAAVHRLKDEGLYYRDIAAQLNLREVLVARVIGGIYHRPKPPEPLRVYVPEKLTTAQAACQNPLCQKNLRAMRQEIGALKRHSNKLKERIIRFSAGVDKDVAAEIRRISDALAHLVEANGFGASKRRRRVFEGDE